MFFSQYIFRSKHFKTFFYEISNKPQFENPWFMHFNRRLWITDLLSIYD